ncbi:Nif3-like dinuclear metal center hexameric protein [Ferrimonas balearica]|uniref:Nif3-like dinuclear metal center hexameric protein n=1 Tax=Ferrimonas balearica TaxID=44012 RepID=UPI001C561CBC|nr:Nif3-like dinuclear metal center hexameric protein [Ferrimonas balearica]MBW3163443.1 Nif3-like dinuclear metal center hexameric protein [Ferrimonas balearica]MBY6223392.1 Nif3-like dinuclear metal center hexameric protein [Ferrimonas balearica]
MLRDELLAQLDQLLKPWLMKDYAPNGLQVEGKPEIRKVVTAVTADQFAVDAAVAAGADALLVHHGYFWKNEAAPIVGMKKRRIEQLIKHDINLIAYHLPLDVHPELGNNAQLAKALGIVNVRPFEEGNETSLVLRGELDPPLSGHELAVKVGDALSRPPLHIAGHQRAIRTIAWCTGGAQDYIDGVAAAGVDAFLSGEVSERTYHSAVEQGIDYYACGHHATERGGVKALGEYLAAELGLDVEFVDTPNPV